MTFQVIAIDKIYPGKNYRTETDETAIKEIAESMRINEMIQPMMVRPVTGKPGYEIVFGYRRFGAAKLIKLKQVPAIVRELTDDQAFEISISENLHRKDVHPMDEAIAYAAYQEKTKIPLEELSLKFGKNAHYIAQRLSFNLLIPDMQKEFYAGKMLIGHAILFSRLTVTDQEVCFKTCKPKFGNTENFEPVGSVLAYIQQNIIRNLEKAVFNPNDAELLASAGSCVTCPKRSGSNLLFGDQTDKDRCYDGTCFSSKTSLYLINKLSDLRTDNEDVAVIGGYNDNVDSAVKKYLSKSKIKLLLEHTDYKSAGKLDKGAIKAFAVSGNHIGELVFIKLTKEGKEAAGALAAKSTPEKNSPEHIDEQIKLIKDKLKDAKKEIPKQIADKVIQRIRDLKPYKESDNTPLQKYELAIFYKGLYDSLMPESVKKVDAILRSITVDKTLSKDQQLVERWAMVPQNTINYLFRLWIDTCMHRPDEFIAYAITKAAAGFKGTKLKEIEKDVTNAYEVQEVNADSKIETLNERKKKLKNKSAGVITPSEIEPDNTNPQDTVIWPGAKEALIKAGINSYNKPSQLLPVANVLPNIELTQSLKRAATDKPIMIKRIINDPSFIVLLRYNYGLLTNDELKIFELTEVQKKSVPDFEFQESGYNGVNALFLKIDNLATEWKKQALKRKEAKN